MAAFTSYHGLYNFICVPFIVFITSSTFQRSMDVRLFAVDWQLALVYSENIVIFSRPSTEHIAHLRKIYTPSNIAEVMLELKRSCLFVENIEDLRLIIHPRRLKTERHTIDTKRGIRTSTNLTRLHSFLGLCNTFRRFLPNFAR